MDASQHLFYQNKFKESHGILEPRSKESVYHAHGLTAIATLEALMTFKPDDFKKALDCADRTLKLSDQLTKVKVVNTYLSKWLTFSVQIVIICQD